MKDFIKTIPKCNCGGSIEISKLSIGGTSGKM